MSHAESTSSNPALRRVVIVGAGFGGLAVARGLRRENVDVRLIDQRNHHLFQPMMYQVAMAQLRSSDIATPLRELFTDKGAVRPRMDVVDGVDLDAHRVRFGSGQGMDYDLLVLATGARYQYLGHPEWQQHVLTLKSLPDTLGLRERIFSALELADSTDNDDRRRAYLKFVIVGAGSTGVELAGALGRILPDILEHRFPELDPEQLQIVLIDPQPHALSSMHSDISTYADRKLRALGVNLMTNTAVDAIEAGKVHLGNGDILDTATIIWAAGVEGHGAGDWLPDELVGKGNRVPVQGDLSVPGYPDVYVIGDAALACDVDGHPYPGLAAVAKQQGAHVARLIRARLAGHATDTHARFDYRDYGSMAMISNGCAVGEIRGRTFKGLAAWLLWGVVHLYFLVSMHNRVLVLCGWFWAMLSGRRQRVTLGSVKTRGDDPLVDADDSGGPGQGAS